MCTLLHSAPSWRAKSRSRKKRGGSVQEERRVSVRAAAGCCCVPTPKCADAYSGCLRSMGEGGQKTRIVVAERCGTGHLRREGGCGDEAMRVTRSTSRITTRMHNITRAHASYSRIHPSRWPSRMHARTETPRGGAAPRRRVRPRGHSVKDEARCGRAVLGRRV